MVEKTPKRYAPVKDTIVKALARTKLSAYESCIVWATIDKTFGWCKKDGSRKTEDYISLSQYVETTGMRESHVSATKKRLIQRRILTERGKFIGINKQVSEWQNLRKGVNAHTAKNLRKGVSELTERGKKNLRKGGDTQRIYRETYTQRKNTKVLVASPQEFGNPDINKIISFSEKLSFGLQGSAKTNRYYAYNLLRKKHGDKTLGVEGVIGLIKLAVQCRGVPYKPQVNDFKTLFNKWQDLITAFQSEKDKQNKGVDYDN